MVNAEPSAWAYDESLRLTVPRSRVAADTVEGEAVIINLDTGAYYTTEGVGVRRLAAPRVGPNVR